MVRSLRAPRKAIMSCAAATSSAIPRALKGHQIANRSNRAARVLLFSKVAVPAVSVYPDTDTIGVWPDDDTEYYFKRGTAISRDVG